MRRLLIVSPSFPPINTPEMHRVRHSLPYFREMGWEPVTLAVEPKYVEGPRDPALLDTVPGECEVHHVPALDQRWTRKIGLGSLALRSLWFYRSAGNRLLSQRTFDLVYFSTTMYPLAVLGPYWKRLFGVPYVIDMQDPWYSDHYDRLPAQQRPPKHWFSSRLNQRLEPVAMRDVDALISVSEDYCETLRARYAHMHSTPCSVIPFGGATLDFDVLDRVQPANPFFRARDGVCNVVYAGRGGHDMAIAAHAIFGALADGLRSHPDLFGRVRIYMIGTDYGRADAGAKTLEPMAALYGVGDRVEEHPGRISYFGALELLRQADMLLLPGSASPSYTASKLYPYILSRSPMLAVFHERSSVVTILRATRASEPVTFNERVAPGDAALRHAVHQRWTSMLSELPYLPPTDWAAFEPYTARTMARRQVEVFDRVVASPQSVRS